MPRNRVIVPCEAVLVGPSPATGRHFTLINSGSNLISGLYRVQSFNWSFAQNRTPVEQFGEMGAIDYVQLSTPTVNWSTNYILANFWNERILGFVTDNSSSCLSNIMNKTQDERNIFVRQSNEGIDANGDTTTGAMVVGIGNCFINSYSFQAAINSFPTVDIAGEGLNVLISSNISGSIPAINPVDGTTLTNFPFTLPTALSSAGTGDLDISALRPGDITLTFKKRTAEDEGTIANATGVYDLPGVNISEANIQNCNLSMAMSREAIQGLGSRYAKARELAFPLAVNLSVGALVGDLTTGNLADLVNCDSAFDITIKLLRPDNCNPALAKTVVAQYNLRNAKLSNQSFSSSIGANKTVQLEFMCQVGGPNQTNMGLYMSGISKY